MSRSRQTTTRKEQPSRRLVAASWLAVVVVTFPVAALAGWLAVAVARITEPVTAQMGLRPLEASSFWAAAVVPLGVVVIGVPFALRFGGRFAAWAFEAEPATSSRTHQRLAMAVARASTTTTRVRCAVIDAHWPGAIALTSRHDRPSLAVTTGSMQLDDAALATLTRAAARELRIDGGTFRLRQALTLPLVAMRAVARSLRLRPDRIVLVLPVLVAPAIIAIPSGTGAANVIPTIGALMVASATGVLAAFAVSGLWMRAIVATGTAILGPVKADPMLVRTKDTKSAVPFVLRPLLHQPGRAPSSHRSAVGPASEPQPAGDASPHTA